MPENDLLKRYLDAGLAFTQMTRERAEAIVRDFVGAGQVQREQASQWVEELVDRSRENTQQIVELIRREVASQLAALGIGEQQGPPELQATVGGDKPVAVPPVEPATAPTSSATATTTGPVAKKAVKKAKAAPTAVGGTAKKVPPVKAVKKVADPVAGPTDTPPRKTTGKVAGTTKKVAKKATGTKKAGGTT